MIVAILNISWQTLADAFSLGGLYALMAVGIGLVFGVLRLVNFAYGQMIMAGAFAIAFGSQWNWPLWGSILLCFAVVLALSLAMEWLVLRPLRMQSPEVTAAALVSDVKRFVNGIGLRDDATVILVTPQ